MKDYEIIIKSFLRMGRLKRLLHSIVEHFPGVTVRIADDSAPGRDPAISQKHRELLKPTLAHRKQIIEFVEQFPNIHFYELPFDTGLSAGRNFLVERVETPYFVLMDDDFIVTSNTRLDRLHKVITSSPSVVIVGGSVIDFNAKHPKGWHRPPGDVEIINGHFRLILYGKNAPKKTVAGVRCTPCGLPHNFFMGSKKLFDEHNLRWEPTLKTCVEWTIFFYSVPKELDVYHTVECAIDHRPGPGRVGALYKKLRLDRMHEQNEELKRISGYPHLFNAPIFRYK